MTEGKSKREALRSLKRHISRELYQRLTAIPLTSWSILDTSDPALRAQRDITGARFTRAGAQKSIGSRRHWGN